MRGDHAPNFSFFAKPDIQNHNIQPGVFSAKMKGRKSVSFLFTVIYELLGYFSWFIVSKSLRIEVFCSILSAMFSHAQLL